MNGATWKVAIPKSSLGTEQLVRTLRYVRPELASAGIAAEGDTLVVSLDETTAARVDHALVQQALDQLADQCALIPDGESAVAWVVGGDQPVQGGERYITLDGRAILRDQQVRLVEALDDWVTRLYSRVGPLAERHYPPVMPVVGLNRSGYLSHHPHFMLFTTRPTSIQSNYATLASTPDTARVVPRQVQLDDPHEGLVPAQCLPTYEELRLDPDADLSDRLITSRGYVTRFETPYADGMRRLTYYQVRELLFLGGADYVLSQRAAAMDAAHAMLRELGVVATCRRAQDAFFTSETTVDQLESQNLIDAKYELLLPAADGTEVAVASFNFAGESLTGRYGLTSRRAGLVSGCVGFGLERFAYCLTEQVGDAQAAIALVSQAVDR